MFTMAALAVLEARVLMLRMALPTERSFKIMCIIMFATYDYE